MVNSTYNNLTDVEVNFYQSFNHVLGLKGVPHKINIFAWLLLLNKTPAKDNLLWRHIVHVTDVACSANCGSTEDIHHLFTSCGVFGRLRDLIAKWLGVSTAFYGNVQDHLTQFGALWGFSKNVCITFNIIWLSII